MKTKTTTKMPREIPIYELMVSPIDGDRKYLRFTIHADTELIWDEDIKMEGLMWWSDKLRLANTDSAKGLSPLLFHKKWGTPVAIIDYLEEHGDKFTGTLDELKNALDEYSSECAKNLVRSRQSQYLSLARS